MFERTINEATDEPITVRVVLQGFCYYIQTDTIFGLRESKPYGTERHATAVASNWAAVLEEMRGGADLLMVA